MNRPAVIRMVFVAALVLLLVWISRNTHWEDITLPATLRGEASTEPLYAAQSFARHLGAQTSKEYAVPSPGSDEVIFLRDWTWDLGSDRRGQLEHWVEAGGRLVMDDSVHFKRDDFKRWSGIEFFTPTVSKEERRRRAKDEVGDCEEWQQAVSSPLTDDKLDRTYNICDERGWQRVRTARRVTWSASDRDGMWALRVPVGQGSVTVIAAEPFLWRDLLKADHAELFVALTQLRSGDRLHFLSEASHPSLTTLAWRYGAPAIVLGGLALLLTLWRNGTRFGPLIPADPPLRRSLAEQIRGTGRFALRYGGGAALHAACVRAMRTAAMRRIPGFGSMGAADQIAAMAQAGETSAASLGAALQYEGTTRSLLTAMAQLESVRRKILSSKARQSHGN